MTRILRQELNRRLSGRSEKEDDMGRWTGIVKWWWYPHDDKHHRKKSLLEMLFD
jgi:hypothetical protein